MPKVNQHNNQSTSQYSKVRVGQSRGVSCPAKSANMLTNSRMWPTARRSKASAIRNTYTSYLCCFINTYFYIPTRLVRVFPLNGLLDKPCTGHRQVCIPFSPPTFAFVFTAQRVQCSHCTSIFIAVCLLALSPFRQGNTTHKKEGTRLKKM